jgi:hypothetical protein
MAPRTICLLAITLFLLAARASAGEATGGLTLVVPQKEYLTFEPILVAVQATKAANLPAALDDKGALRFEISPAVKRRPGAKPLPVEAKTDKARTRVYDLLEWYAFPAEGSFTIRASLEAGGENGTAALTSATVSIVLRRPAKEDSERTAVERLHHLPWSNYCTDKFCGDTFDVVKQWPKSRLVPYCHYYNGVFSQHHKEYEQAAASYRTLLKEHPASLLADHAAVGLAESLLAVNKKDEAVKALQERVDAVRPDQVRSEAAATRIQTLLRDGR